MKLEGSCHCGAVSFSLDSKTPYPYDRCYCSICRKTAGSGGYAVNIMGEAKTLALKGAEHIQIYQANVDGKRSCQPSDSKTPYPYDRCYCSISAVTAAATCTYRIRVGRTSCIPLPQRSTHRYLRRRRISTSCWVLRRPGSNRRSDPKTPSSTATRSCRSLSGMRHMQAATIVEKNALTLPDSAKTQGVRSRIDGASTL